MNTLKAQVEENNQAKVIGFRRNNQFLHTWASLLLIWLLYAVFLTGTLSFFRQELLFWSKPELHQKQQVPMKQNLTSAIAYLNQHAGQATQWRINLPNVRQPFLHLSWQTASLDGQKKPEKKQAYLDASTATELKPRASNFINFLYRFHFELYAVERKTGRLIVGIATLFMLVALITGIIIHKRIFIEFFTFTQGKKLKSWLQFHNLSAVVALPFHLVICYSGLLLIMYLLMPWGIESAYQGDVKAFKNAGGSKRIVAINSELSPKVLTHLPIKADLPLNEKLLQMSQLAQLQWPNGVKRIQLSRKSTENWQIELSQLGGDSLLNRGNSERWAFNGHTGELLWAKMSDPNTHGARITYNVLSALHLQRYAGPLSRWLFFLSGLIATLMIATGAIIWVQKRQNKQGDANHAGVRLVQVLNVGVMTGMPLAIIITLSINQWISAQYSGRESLEINVFFCSWLFAFIHSAWANYQDAWRQQLLLIAICSALLVLVKISLFYAVLVNKLPALKGLVFDPEKPVNTLINIIKHNWQFWQNGDLIIISTDLFLVLISLGCFACYLQLKNRQQERRR